MTALVFMDTETTGLSLTDERHTAMGDVRWAMALYDAIAKREKVPDA